MFRRIIMILAAAILITGLLAGCSGQQAAQTETEAASEAVAADLSQYAGEYFFYGTYLNENFVMIEDLEGTSTVLNADGTGYLNWGENNSGPISEWAVSEQSIQLKAGESVISGQIRKGIMLLSIGDAGSEFLECYVTEEADTSDMPQITAEEWAEMIAGSID